METYWVKWQTDSTKTGIIIIDIEGLCSYIIGGVVTVNVFMIRISPHSVWQGWDSLVCVPEMRRLADWMVAMWGLQDGGYVGITGWWLCGDYRMVVIIMKIRTRNLLSGC